jgi:hypothetical protein
MPKDFESIIREWSAKNGVEFSSVGKEKIKVLRRDLAGKKIESGREAESIVRNFLSGEKPERRNKFSDSDIGRMAEELESSYR